MRNAVRKHIPPSRRRSTVQAPVRNLAFHDDGVFALARLKPHRGAVRPYRHVVEAIFAVRRWACWAHCCCSSGSRRVRCRSPPILRACWCPAMKCRNQVSPARSRTSSWRKRPNGEFSSSARGPTCPSHGSLVAFRSSALKIALGVEALLATDLASDNALPAVASLVAPAV